MTIFSHDIRLLSKSARLSFIMVFFFGAETRSPGAPDDRDAERLKESAPPAVAKIAEISQPLYALIGLPEMVRKYHPRRIGPQKIPKKVLDASIRLIRGCVKPEWLPAKSTMYETVVGLPDFTTFVGRDKNGIVFGRLLQDILYWKYPIGKRRVLLIDTGCEVVIVVKSPDIRVPDKPRKFMESWLARLVEKKFPISDSRIREVDGTYYANVPLFVTAHGKKHRSGAGICCGPGYFFVRLLYSLVDPDYPFDKHVARAGIPVSRF